MEGEVRRENRDWLAHLIRYETGIDQGRQPWKESTLPACATPVGKKGLFSVSERLKCGKNIVVVRGKIDLETPEPISEEYSYK